MCWKNVLFDESVRGMVVQDVQPRRDMHVRDGVEKTTCSFDLKVSASNHISFCVR